MRALAILAVFVACAGSLFAEIRIVRTTSQGKATTISTDVRETSEGDGLRVQQKSEEGSVTTLLGGDGTVRSTELLAKDGTIHMSSDGTAVTVSGTWKGKAVAGRCELKGLGFYGSGFEFAVRALARGGLQSLKFPMINPADPSKATVMELAREGSDSFRGREAIKV